MDIFLTNFVRPEQVIAINGKAATVKNVEGDVVQIHRQGEIPQHYKMQTLLELYQEGKLDLGVRCTGEKRELADLDSLSSEQLQRIEELTPYVMPLFEERRPTCSATRRRVNEKAQRDYPNYPSISQRRQYKLYNAVKSLGGSRLGLLNEGKRRKKGIFEDHRQDLIVNRLYHDKFLKRLESQYRQIDFIKDVNTAITTANEQIDRPAQIKPVSQPSISRFLAARRNDNPLHFDRCRKGQEHYRRSTRGQGEPHKARRILESAQFDFTDPKIIIVDVKHGVVLGKPTIGTLFDNKSKSILGIAIAFSGETSALAAKVLRNAILPKNGLISGYDSIKNPWVTYGIPAEIIVDMGSGFISDAFNDICARLNIEKIDAKGGHPWLKAMVESLFSTMGQGPLRLLPANTEMDADVKAMVEKGQAPAVTLEDFYETLLMWICDTYMVQVHGDQAIIPNDVWNQQEELYPPRLPMSVSQLDVALGIPITVTLQEYGFQFLNLRYTRCAHNEIQALKERLPRGHRKVTVKYNPDDLGAMWVYNHLDDTWFRVEANFGKYARGLSLRAHKYLRRQISERKRRNMDEPELLDARLRLEKHCAEIAQQLGRNPGSRPTRSDQASMREFLVASSDIDARQEETIAMKGAIVESLGIENIIDLENIQRNSPASFEEFDFEAFSEAAGEILDADGITETSP